MKIEAKRNNQSSISISIMKREKNEIMAGNQQQSISGNASSESSGISNEKCKAISSIISARNIKKTSTNGGSWQSSANNQRSGASYHQSICSNAIAWQKWQQKRKRGVNHGAISISANTINDICVISWQRSSATNALRALPRNENDSQQ